MDRQNFKKIIKQTKRNHSQQHHGSGKISFNLKSIHAKKRNKQKQTFTDRFSEQNKDLKIYAKAKPKFKPKCLTSNVKKKTQKTSKSRSAEEAAAKN